MAATHISPPDRRYDKRLAIVVPYRNRVEHLEKLLPHFNAYFTRDKLDRRLAVSVHVVEQSGDAPFNRGMIKNCGYTLAKADADYVCFHDVDYLPIWADYAWSAPPARLIWHGLTLREDWDRFFGGVVLFDNAAFESVNGYPNAYWGWGPEDLELGLRCDVAGLGFERRDGTYMALAHAHAGFAAPGIYTDEALKTMTLWTDRSQRLGYFMDADGLSELKFSLLKQQRMPADGTDSLTVFHHLVDIGTPPNSL
jgi:N-terminal region of glycosyl transferase group 7/N-terminal domain of galactosyltransferase